MRSDFNRIVALIPPEEVMMLVCLSHFEVYSESKVVSR